MQQMSEHQFAFGEIMFTSTLDIGRYGNPIIVFARVTSHYQYAPQYWITPTDLSTSAM